MKITTFGGAMIHTIAVIANDRIASIFTFRGADALLEPKDLKPGAGDAFNTTFASFVAESSSEKDAALAAAANSASVIAHLDRMTGLLHRNSLENVVASVKNTLDLRRWPS